MKIFIPIGTFYPNQTNGPSLSLYWLAKGLSKNNLDVTIYTTNIGITNLPQNQFIYNDFGKVKYFETKRLKSPFKLIYNSIKDFYKFDIVLITSLFYPLSVILLFYSFLFKKKIIISPRGELYKNAISSKSYLYKYIYISILRIFLKIKSKNYIFHVTSEDEKFVVSKYFGINHTIYVIPNYIEMPYLHDKIISKTYLLFLGRIHQDKALDKLIDGFSLSKNARKFGIKLFLTGDSNNQYGLMLKNKIKDLNLSDSICFIGFVEGESKENLISNAYCTLLVSNSENFGNSVLESLCFGTPVITSTGTPWKELVVENCGYWIENNPLSIAKTIDEILELDTNVYKLMCDNCRHLATLKYGIYENINDWMKILI